MINIVSFKVTLNLHSSRPLFNIIGALDKRFPLPGFMIQLLQLEHLPAEGVLRSRQLFTQFQILSAGLQVITRHLDALGRENVLLDEVRLYFGLLDIVLGTKARMFQIVRLLVKLRHFSLHTLDTERVDFAPKRGVVKVEQSGVRLVPRAHFCASPVDFLLTARIIRYARVQLEAGELLQVPTHEISKQDHGLIHVVRYHHQIKDAVNLCNAFFDVLIVMIPTVEAEVEEEQILFQIGPHVAGCILYVRICIVQPFLDR